VSDRAKIFQNGGRQAVRLHKHLRSRDDEVLMRRVGEQLIRKPADEWPADFLACLGAWRHEIATPPARRLANKRSPFDGS
jgi:virulence-associated protein VagC